MVIKILAVHNENKEDMPDEKEEKKEDKGEKEKRQLMEKLIYRSFIIINLLFKTHEKDKQQEIC